MTDTDFDAEMIQRKLSGVYSAVTVDVPFAAFTEYVEAIQSNLHDHGVLINVNDLMMNPEVVKRFEQGLDETVRSATGYMTNVGDPYRDARVLFSDEIAHAEAERDERERVRLETFKSSTVAIIVEPENIDKARNILRAAGLLPDISVTSGATMSVQLKQPAVSDFFGLEGLVKKKTSKKTFLQRMKDFMGGGKTEKVREW